MRILVVNSGSSSLKLRVIDDDDRVAARADLDAVAGAGAEEIRAAVARVAPFDAVGHRIVHGARLYTAPVRIDAAVRGDLEELAPLAPLHQPPALQAVDVLTELAPDVPAVACFDTSFHATRRPRQPPTPSRGTGATATASASTGSTGSPTPGPPGAPSSSSAPDRDPPGSSPATSGLERRSPPQSTGGASTRPWASPRWTGS